MTIYSVEEADGVHFLTMELVEGQTLDRVIPKGGLPIGRLVDIGAALTEALHAAHEKGIIHRDLKPANVMVGEGGRVKVLDFGLAKVEEPEELSRGESELRTALETREGIVMGTMSYMSPEQVQGRTLDGRSDIFSLGVILYEMVSGGRPFCGDSTAELVSSILRDTPRPLGAVRADASAGLERVVLRCLEKDSRQRIQCARGVGDDLREVGRSSAASMASLPTMTGGPGARLADQTVAGGRSASSRPSGTIPKSSG